MTVTHFRFGVGCHDLNGFWYSNNLMHMDNPDDMNKQWETWKNLEKELERLDDDPREMLIDQYDIKDGSIGDTIVIPSKYADDIQKQIFGDKYGELKFDIFSEDVKPMSLGEMLAEANDYLVKIGEKKIELKV